MKRIFVVAVLLFASAAYAEADNSVYTSKCSNSDADLQAAAQYCDQQLGTVKNGEITPAPYKKCMASRGWRYQYTTRAPAASEHTWIDPDTGDTCHDILGGLGSSCGNF
jgi:Tfp pilus assembly protein PilE